MKGYVEYRKFQRYDCLTEKIDQLTRDDLAELVKSVDEALKELHAKGWAHLDVRVENICWDGSQVRLIDLDRAKKRDKKTKNTKLWQLLHVFMA